MSALNDLLTAIAKFAPLIASVIPLPGATIIGQIVASAFGGDISRPEELAKIIKSDPESQIKLEQIQADLRVQLQTIAATNYANELLGEKVRLDNLLALAESDRLDRQSARELSRISNMPAAISIIILVGFFSFLITILVVKLTLDSIGSNILYLSFGTLSTSMAVVVAYWLGSNASSSKTNDALISTGSNASQIKSDLLVTTVATDKKLTDLKTVTDQVHTLTNSNMGIQLRMNMVLSARVAELTGAQGDKDAAILAKTLYDEHEKAQAIVDSSKSR